MHIFIDREPEMKTLKKRIFNKRLITCDCLWKKARRKNHTFE